MVQNMHCCNQGLLHCVDRAGTKQQSRRVCQCLWKSPIGCDVLTLFLQQQCGLSKLTDLHSRKSHNLPQIVRIWDQLLGHTTSNSHTSRSRQSAQPVTARHTHGPRLYMLHHHALKRRILSHQSATTKYAVWSIDIALQDLSPSAQTYTTYQLQPQLAPSTTNPSTP